MFSIQTLDLLGENLVKFKKSAMDKDLPYSVDTSLDAFRAKHMPRHLDEVTTEFFNVRV